MDAIAIPQSDLAIVTTPPTRWVETNERHDKRTRAAG